VSAAATRAGEPLVQTCRAGRLSVGRAWRRRGSHEAAEGARVSRTRTEHKRQRSLHVVISISLDLPAEHVSDQGRKQRDQERYDQQLYEVLDIAEPRRDPLVLCVE
jgi:hypothetical protein